MKQLYLLKLCLLIATLFLLTENVFSGNTFVPKDYSYTFISTSTENYGDIELSEVFTYPEALDDTAHFSPDSILFDFGTDTYISLYSCKYSKDDESMMIYLNLAPYAAGKRDVKVSIIYHGDTIVNTLHFNAIALEAREDNFAITPDSIAKFDVVKNDYAVKGSDGLKLSVLQQPKNGTVSVLEGTYDTLQYIPNAGIANYTKDSLLYKVTSEDGYTDSAMVHITIRKNPYASRVIAFLPAPGQFINSGIGQSNSAENILGDNGGMISLGGFGGYVILGFDQPIVNDPHNPYGVDFSTRGNAFGANLYGVWCEPGAVQVMKDKNHNGIPDDGEWYELAGSDYWLNTTQRNVKMTYYNPQYDVRHTTPWKLSTGENGAQVTNGFHRQPYYPNPFDFNCNKDSITFSGNLIKSTIDMSTPSYIVFARAPIFGYCDSRGVSTDMTDPQNPYYKDSKGKAAEGFDLNWAVDTNGNHVDLDTVDFVKIYTAGSVNAGWLGEWSTEVLEVAITKPDPQCVPQDYYVNYLGIPQLKVVKGETCQFQGILFKNGRPVNEGTPKFWVSDTNIGTIDDTGLFTGKKTGEIWIYFQQNMDRPADSMQIAVVSLASVVLEMEGNSSASSDTVSMINGEKIYITAQSTDSVTDVLNNSTSNRFTYDTYTWTTSNPEIGTIDNGLFTAKKVGRTLLHAYSNIKPELYDSITVIVTPVPRVKAVSDTVYIAASDAEGQKKSGDLFATGNYSTTYLNSVNSWRNTANPFIDKNYLNYNFAPGNYAVDSLSFDMTSYRRDTTIGVIFVYGIATTAISLDSTHIGLKKNETARLVATVSPTNATYSSIIWSSNNNNVATVDQNGLITAEDEGEATITASVGNRNATCLVTVSTVISGIQEPEATLQIYPNPFKNYIIVTTDKNENAAIMGLDGRIFIKAHLTIGRNRIDTSILPPGVYVLKAGDQTKKLIK